MANVLAELFQNTANAIREKTGDSGTMKPAEFPDKIKAIAVGGESANLVPLTVTENGTYYPPKSTVEVGNTYTFKTAYTQEELKSLYDSALYHSDDGVWATLFGNLDGTGDAFGVMYQYGMYGAFVASGLAWIPEALASQIGSSEGWHQGADISSMTKLSETPSFALSSNYASGVEDLALLDVLFELPSVADGFSSVEVNVSGALKFVETYGSYSAEKAGIITVNHNLGVIPDIVTIKITEQTSGSTNGDIISIECVPNEDISKYTQIVQYRTDTGVTRYSQKTNIADVANGLITVTPNTFSVGGAMFTHAVDAYYRYNVIGGLIERPYVEIALNLDGDGNLIVTGGVPEIEQLNIYVDGVIAKTVDYVHSDEFIVDISELDVFVEFREYTIGVEAVGDNFKAKYPIVFYKSVVGYFGTSSGSCGESVNYTMRGNGNGMLEIYGTGEMADYDATSEQPWSNYASGIKRVVVSEGVTSTGMRAFQYTAAETIELPNSLTKIGNNFAYGCRSLTSINIPDNVKSVGSSAFSGCAALTNVTIPDGVTSIEQYTFSESSIESIIIPDKVTQILWRAFQNCRKLTTVTIGNSVNLIGDNAFWGCTSLTSVIFKDVTEWLHNTSQTSTSGTKYDSASLADPRNAASIMTSEYFAGRWWHKV